MKKFLLSLAAATTVLAVPVSASAADYSHNDRNGRYEQRYDRHDNGSRYDKQQYKRFQKGQRFDSRQARNYRQINNPRAYHLRDAPRGQHWVQSGNDALLVGLVGGVIGAVIANAF